MNLESVIREIGVTIVNTVMLQFKEQIKTSEVLDLVLKTKPMKIDLEGFCKELNIDRELAIKAYLRAFDIRFEYIGKDGMKWIPALISEIGVREDKKELVFCSGFGMPAIIAYTLNELHEEANSDILWDLLTKKII